MHSCSSTVAGFDWMHILLEASPAQHGKSLASLTYILEERLKRIDIPDAATLQEWTYSF